MFVRADQVIGYMYDAALYHADCVIERLIRRGIATPAARDMDPEQALDRLADANGIDREDEFSFDSGEFPKAVLVDDVEGAEVCDECLEELF